MEEEAGQIPATRQRFRITFGAYELCSNPAADDTATIMHPELRALINEACAREDCPEDLRASAAEYLSGAASRVPYPSMHALHLGTCWFNVWSGLSLASDLHPSGPYMDRARRHLDRLKSPEPPR